MKKLFVLIAVCLSTFSFAETAYKDIEFLAMENFSVEKKDGEVHVGFDYVIKNPNWYNIVIKPSSLFLKIADTDCGWVRVEEKVKIIAKETKGYHFVLVGESSQFVKSSFNSIWNMITGQGITFNIAGDLKGGIFLFKPKWKIDYTYRMTMDEFLSFF